MNYDFGEKSMEYSPKQGKDVSVWLAPKYKESKAKAVELLDSKKYGLTPSDFWILMNETKSGKMAYSGLIISHAGCLKINDGLESRFDADSVTVDKDGWNGSLVCIYRNKAQGLFEVGEVSAKNCKNEYPYAMAVKRLFDRVVLKLSKVAYAGIYGEDEADEFRYQGDDPGPKPTQKAPKTTPRAPREEPEPEEPPVVCENCGAVLRPYAGADGKMISVDRHAAKSQKVFGEILCLDCINARTNG